MTLFQVAPTCASFHWAVVSGSRNYTFYNTTIIRLGFQTNTTCNVKGSESSRVALKLHQTRALSLPELYTFNLTTGPTGSTKTNETVREGQNVASISA